MEHRHHRLWSIVRLSESDLTANPTGTGSHEVPLRRLHWSWHDKAQYDESLFKFKQAPNQDGAPVQKSESVEESTHPQWDDKSENHNVMK